MAKWHYAVAAGLLVMAVNALAGPGEAPLLTGAALRKLHGTASSFDLPLSLLSTNPTTEPRTGPSHTLVLKFDKIVSGGSASVAEGSATAGSPSFSGSEMIVPLTGVTSAQYVTVAVVGVTASDGGSGGKGAVRIGFLEGDVSQNRLVDAPDVARVNDQLAQPVSAANYLADVNATGTMSLADKLLVSSRQNSALASPPAAANQPPAVAVPPAALVFLPEVALLPGNVTDDGLPNPPGTMTTAWTVISSSGTVAFGNAGKPQTHATLSAAGAYVLRLTANDGAIANFADIKVEAVAPTVSLTISSLVAPIAIREFALGASSSTTLSSGGGGGAGKVNYRDVSFSAAESTATPSLLLLVSNGLHTSTAKVEVRSPDSGALLSDWVFTDFVVTSMGMSASTETVSTLTHFSLGFARIKYRILAADGSVVTQSCFDIKQNIAC